MTGTRSYSLASARELADSRELPLHLRLARTLFLRGDQDDQRRQRRAHVVREQRQHVVALALEHVAAHVCVAQRLQRFVDAGDFGRDAARDRDVRRIAVAERDDPAAERIERLRQQPLRGAREREQDRDAQRGRERRHDDLDPGGVPVGDGAAPRKVDDAVAQQFARPEIRHDRSREIGGARCIGARLAGGDGRIDERKEVAVEGGVELRVLAHDVGIVELRADRAVDQRAQLLDAAAHPHDVRELRAIERLPREHRRDQQRARAARIFPEIAEQPRQQDRARRVRVAHRGVGHRAVDQQRHRVDDPEQACLRVLDIVNGA
ncbi:hypothetical protein [Burkholderia stabilis]